MKPASRVSTFFVFAILALTFSQAAYALNVTRAKMREPKFAVAGNAAVPGSTVTVTLAGRTVGKSRAGSTGKFSVRGKVSAPSTCDVTVSDGATSQAATLVGCTVTAPPPPTSNITITRAAMKGAKFIVEGGGAAGSNTITLSIGAQDMGTTGADNQGDYYYSGSVTNPSTCDVTATDGLSSATATLTSCAVATNSAPAASFTVGAVDLTATFTSTSTDSDGTIASFAWNFGDGATATTAAPQHVYATGGTYSVTLIVTDDGGATDKAIQSVTVTDPVMVNIAPTAGFTATPTDLDVAFTSTSTDSDGTIVSYAWTFGDGATAAVASPSHAYAVGGAYDVTLTVIDNDGASDSFLQSVTVTDPAPPPGPVAGCDTTGTADIVALSQAFFFNRMGAVNASGQIYALRRDIVDATTGLSEAEGAILSPGNVMLRSNKRPRPIVLRMNVGDCLTILFENLLDPIRRSTAQPATREASVYVMGMQFAGKGDYAAYVGTNVNTLIAPGGNGSYTFYAEREGGYLLHDAAAMAGGEGNGGSLSTGLFGSVNVEPAGAQYYRSQVTKADLDLATTGTTADGHPIIDYEAVYPVGHQYEGIPILNMISGNEIVHTDLNAIITGPNRGDFPPGTYTANPVYEPNAVTSQAPNSPIAVKEGRTRNEPFREFTIIFHDEVANTEAFPGWFNDPVFRFTLKCCRDKFAINYGTGGIGSEIIANRLGVGPVYDCVGCKYEEFFLTSWALGDPAMVVDVPANVGLESVTPSSVPDPLALGPKATMALYPDDPSNVHHSYTGDHVKMRNLSAGPGEHHLFHLHSHQWLYAPDSDKSAYLDSQAIGPGDSYTYEITYNGTGNRNQTPGDSIFHCHFYPHFAQGMWSLWRSHDVFEAGTELDLNGRPAPGSRALPDAEIMAGTPIPALVPLPTLAMAPMPGPVQIVDGQVDILDPTINPGYPFFIPGEAGQRPPHPPLDHAEIAPGEYEDGGLPRHLLVADPKNAVYSVVNRLDFTKEVLTVEAIEVPEDGTEVEKTAMAFHAERVHPSYTSEGTPLGFVTNGLPPKPGAPFADPCIDDSGVAVDHSPRVYRAANIQLDVVFNKLGWHQPQARMLALWGDVEAFRAGTKPPEPFFFRANTNDCIEFQQTNLVPNYYELDDFQVRTPTDVLGQHIHLVKFDVTSSDGSANGWNYEDGTFSPGEVIERIDAINAGGGLVPAGGGARVPLTPKAHSFFGTPGAETIIQRWFADDVLNNAGDDRTLRTVFTHDHFGPSTHQQVGLYASLVVEPEASQWRNPETGEIMGGRFDGGPTGFRADILTANPDDSYREFMLQFADFALAYEAGSPTVPDPVWGYADPTRAINPAGVCDKAGVAPPCPEAISAIGSGSHVVNYRNEPLSARTTNLLTTTSLEASDMSYAFGSIDREDPVLNVQTTGYDPLTAGIEPTDPFTPLLRAYENDDVQVRLIVGATEEMHNFSIHGVKWLLEPSDPNSGYKNSQAMGISEHFELAFTLPPTSTTVDRPHADYLYTPGSTSGEVVDDGLWGIMRAYDGLRPDLLPLPNNPSGQAPGPDSDVCPADAPARFFSVTATTAEQALPGGTLMYNQRPGYVPIHDPQAMLYILSSDLDASDTLLPGAPIEPLILRAAAGDCIVVVLRNMVDPLSAATTSLVGAASSSVGLHAQLVSYDVTKSDGANVGMNPVQTAAPGEVRTYRWYAGNVAVNPDGTRTYTPVELGAANLSPADMSGHASRGMVGALIIEPQGSTWVEDAGTRAAATVTKADGTTFRDFVLIYQDALSLRVGTSFIIEDPQPAINYRTDPMWHRFGYSPNADDRKILSEINLGEMFGNEIAGGDPVTPVFTATAGTPVRFRVLNPGGADANHTFEINGHVWQRQPYINGSTEIGDNPLSEWTGGVGGFGPTSHMNVVLENGAGSKFQVNGDYLYRDRSRDSYTRGIWGILRVTP